MRTRRLVLLVIVPILGFYLCVTLAIAVALWRDGRAVSRGLALGLLVVDIVSAGLVVAELRFGRQVEALSRAYDATAPDPAGDGGPLPLAPSGHPDRAAADAAFEAVKARVEERPDDWRGWYELGLAYGDSRDSARGRRAMRRAIALRAARR